MSVPDWKQEWSNRKKGLERRQNIHFKAVSRASFSWLLAKFHLSLFSKDRFICSHMLGPASVPDSSSFILLNASVLLVLCLGNQKALNCNLLFPWFLTLRVRQTCYKAFSVPCMCVPNVWKPKQRGNACPRRISWLPCVVMTFQNEGLLKVSQSSSCTNGSHTRRRKYMR